MYQYETHLHTSPVSKCAKATVRESLKFYKEIGYDGVFITNHFLGGSLNIDQRLPYEEILQFYFSDYEDGVKIGKEIGLKVFLGIEMGYGGTDFLIYGLDKEFYFSHPEIRDMTCKEKLTLFQNNGALIIHAHPFREAPYIDHIRLFPRNVHGVEVINACRTDFENEMALLYAENYNLPTCAGSDNHAAAKLQKLAGMCSEREIHSEKDFIDMFQNGELQTFTIKR